MKQPKKILFCIDCLIRGGTELQLSGLIEHLDPAQCKPYLLTLRPSQPGLVPANCIHLDWHLPKLFSLAGIISLFKLVAFMRRERIDIVQTFFQDSTIFAGLAAYLARVKIRLACFRDMGFWLTAQQKRVLKRVYRLMTGYLCNARAVGEHFCREFSLNPKLITVVPNGVTIESFSFVAHPGECKHVGIVGNLTRQVKRTDLFIKAAARLAPQYPNVRWHIIGDGHMRAEMEQLAAGLGLGQALVFHGRVSNVPQLIETLDIGVISSDSEGLSNAIIEYMLKGTSCVATAVGGNPELIDHGKTGLLVPPNDDQSLANAIEQLISNSPLRQQIAHNARIFAEQEFNWATCLSKHYDVYNQ